MPGGWDVQASHGAPAIVVEALTKRFKRQLAVDQLSFTVPMGTITGFLGPNGAGKTTTLRILVGLTQPTAGAATILGRPYRDLDDPARTVGAIVEGAGFHPGRRAVDELRILATAAGVDRSRCDEVLELTGIAAAAGKRVGQYSLGMRQRLALAAALLGDPRILILDEPANGLDPEGIHWVRGFLRWLADDGRAVLVSSHLLDEIARVADDVVVIHRGRLVTHAPVADLTGTTGAGIRVRSLNDARLTAALRDGGGEVVTEDGHLTIRGLDAEAVGRVALDHGVVLVELRRVNADLETVFFQLTGQETA